MLRPARAGTGVIAGGAVRVVLQMAGVRNGYGKQLGCNNKLNNARATVQCLASMRTVNEVSSPANAATLLTLQIHSCCTIYVPAFAFGLHACVHTARIVPSAGQQLRAHE